MKVKKNDKLNMADDKLNMADARIDYIVYGWELPFDFINEDELDTLYEYSDNTNGYSIILDRRSEEFAVFGYVLETCADDEGWFFNNVDFGDYKRHDVIGKFKELFKVEPDEPAQLAIFSISY